MKILLCTDGSSYAEAACDLGSHIAKKAQAEVTVLGVAESSKQRGMIQEEVARLEDKLRGLPSVRTRIRIGQAADQILAQSEEDEYNLMAIGSRGRRGITRFLMGSTALRVTRYAFVPTLVVKSERETIDKVLIATAAGRHGGWDIEFGGEVARIMGASVTILHVMSPFPVTQEAEEDYLRYKTEVPTREETEEAQILKEGVDKLSQIGVSAESKIRAGVVTEEIFREAREGKYDLIVIGAHRPREIPKYLLGDVAGEILLYSQRPVLVVRPKLAEPEVEA